MVKVDKRGGYWRAGVALITMASGVALAFACSPEKRPFGGGAGDAGDSASPGVSGAGAGVSGSSNLGGRAGNASTGGTSATAGEPGLGGSSEDGGSPSVTNPCATDPCINGGVCSAQGDIAVCSCGTAYTGEHCEKNVDDCAASPCQNAGTCVDGTGTYTCSCATGFSGEHCERAVSKCDDKPCLNNGTCVDQAASYKCTCPSGFSGTNCELNVDECAANPCKNGAACVDGVNTYTCQCKPGYSGTTCQTDIDDCASKPCLNGSTCVDKVNAYSCTCKAGYTGTNCQTDIDDCASKPCQNNGNCADGVNAHTCTCTNRYTGPNCEYLEVKLAPDNLTASAYTTNASALSNDGKVLLFQYSESGGSPQVGRLVDFESANLVSLSNPLIGLDASGYGIDNDGATIVGSASSSADGTYYSLKQVGPTSSIIDVSQFQYGAAPQRATDVSADGTTIVGMFLPGSSIISSFYCKGAQACKDVPVTGSWQQIGATSVNGDGSVVVGFAYTYSPTELGAAWRWVTSAAKGTTLPLNAATWTAPHANAVSRDGLVVVGDVQINGVLHAVRWSGASFTATDLGTGRASGTSSDGSVTVGVDNSSVPLVWLGTTRQTLASLLGTNPDLTGATLTDLVAVSDNGKVVGGTAKVGGVDHAFMARLP